MTVAIIKITSTNIMINNIIMSMVIVRVILMIMMMVMMMMNMVIIMRLWRRRGRRSNGRGSAVITYLVSETNEIHRIDEVSFLLRQRILVFGHVRGSISQVSEID